MSNDHSTYSGFLSKLLGKCSGRDAVQVEKARLEAFLDAVPGEYCGWTPSGAVAYSDGFCQILGVQQVNAIEDIQEHLDPGDAAALEGLFARLQDKGEAFSVNVKTADSLKSLRLSGKHGLSYDNLEEFNVLWLEDITRSNAAYEEALSSQSAAEQERDMLQTALDKVSIPMWMRNANSEIVWCNRAYAGVLGATPASVIAEQKEMPIKSLQKGPSSKMLGRQMAVKALEAKEEQKLPAHVIVDGKRRRVDLCEMPLSSLHMTLGVAFDVTREEELETEQKRYLAANKELLEQLGTAIVMYGADQKLEFYNSAFGQLWDLEESYLNTHPKLGEIMEKLRENRRLPEQADWRKFKQSWLNMFTALIGPHESMMYLPSGKALRMLVIPHPMGGMMMTFEDVTSRLELESSYNTLIAVQKETLDHLSEGVAVYGGDGRIKLWNPSFARLWGFNPEDLDSEPHVSRLAEKKQGYFTKKDWPDKKELLLSLGLSRRAVSGRLERKDGTLVSYSTVPLPDGGVLVTQSDITDKVRVENALREKNAALETAERLKLDFLANVSYQLRTPLNAIMGFAEILDQEFFGKLSDKQKEYTQGIEEAGERLLTLINNILDLSTIEAGYMELEPEEFSVHEMLSGLYDLTSEWARKQKIEVVLECPKNIGVFYADQRRLKQVLLNLMRNAISFTPEGGKITLAAKKTKDGLSLSVTDSGRGIAKERQSRIFEPFEKAASQSASGGAGLGLTLVKNIVALHGGKVELESAPEKGATFTVILPEKTGKLTVPIKKKAVAKKESAS